MKKIFILTALVGIFFSSVLLVAGQGNSNISFRTLAHDSSGGGYREKGNFLIKSAQDWEEFWKSYASAVLGENKALPEVDFSKEMVAVACYGLGGYRQEIAITGIVEDTDKITVSLTETRDDGEAFKGQMVPKIFTYPIHIVAMPKSDLPVKFVNVRWPKDAGLSVPEEEATDPASKDIESMTKPKEVELFWEKHSL